MHRAPKHTDWIIWERDPHIAKGPCHLSRHEAGTIFQWQGFICQNPGNPGLPAFHSTLPAAQLESLSGSCKQKLETRPSELFQWPQLPIHAKPLAILGPWTGNKGTAMPKAIPETPDSGLYRLPAASLDQMVPMLVSCASAQRALAEGSLLPQLHSTWFLPGQSGYFHHQKKK